MTNIVVVTGTGTDIGKTVATAALAAVAGSSGLRAGVCKPIQTGLQPGQPGDVERIAELSGISDVLEIRRLADPLAPETAARVAGLAQSSLSELAGPVRPWCAPLDLALVEGAGGVLVRLGTDVTVLDLARELRASVLVVTRARLGTLSDTELAVRAVRDAGLRCAGLVVGAMPAEPDLATRCNLDDLPRLVGAPIVGTIPEGAGDLRPETFRQAAPGWFAPGALAELRKAS